MHHNALLGIISAAALGITAIGAGASAEGTSPFLGTWMLNVSQSPNSGYTSETMRVVDTDSGSLHVIIDRMGTDGSSSQIEYTTMEDGRTVPVTGSAAVDAGRFKVTGNTVTYSFLKAGKRVRWGALTVASDGKSLRGAATTAMPDGKRVKSRLVFDRQ